MRISKTKEYEIVKMLRDGCTYDLISSSLNTSKETISKIKKSLPEFKSLKGGRKKIIRTEKIRTKQTNIYTYMEIQKALEIWSWINQKRLLSKEKRDFLRDFIIRANEK